MWRSDPLVQKDFGLKRRLCNRCGLYVSVGSPRPPKSVPDQRASAETNQWRRPPNPHVVASAEQAADGLVAHVGRAPDPRTTLDVRQ